MDRRSFEGRLKDNSEENDQKNKRCGFNTGCGMTPGYESFGGEEWTERK